MAFTEEEIRIVQARRAARAARAAREAAGLSPEEPEPPQQKSFRKRLRKLLLIGIVGGLTILATFTFWSYGTLSPCGALAQTLHEALLQEAVSEAITSAQTPSPETSARSRFPAVDLRIEALSPAQCTTELVQFERSNRYTFVDRFLEQSTPSPRTN